jgi:hypothetical protein
MFYQVFIGETVAHANNLFIAKIFLDMQQFVTDHLNPLTQM